MARKQSIHYRKINGRTYTLYATRETKGRTDYLADRLRNEYKSVRVVKIPGKGAYGIYVYHPLDFWERTARANKKK